MFMYSHGHVNMDTHTCTVYSLVLESIWKNILHIFQLMFINMCLCDCACGSWTAFRIPSLHGLHGGNKTWHCPLDLQRSAASTSEVTKPCCMFSCEPIALQARPNSAVAKRSIAKSLFVRESMPHRTARLFWEHQVRTCNAVAKKPLCRTSTGSKVTTPLLNQLRTCWLPLIAKVPHYAMGLLWFCSLLY